MPVSSVKNTISLFLRAARVHQWVKNILVFIPLFLAHKMTDPESLLEVVIAFISFCLCASSVYVLNDIHDLEADRQHPVKRNRPLASGELSVMTGIAFAVLLLAAGILLAYAMQSAFIYFVLLYIIATLIYSHVLKSIALADVVILAGLYTVRIIGGAIAANTEITFWLLAFSLFFFFSLAMVKRHSELLALSERGETSASGRGYLTLDTNLVLMLGVASGYLSVLIFALYLNESTIIIHYSSPYWLWLITPILLYWIGRVWLLANRGKVSEDPVVFAVKDKVSYLMGLLCVISIVLAR